jgi:hypothetical protein
LEPNGIRPYVRRIYDKEESPAIAEVNAIRPYLITSGRSVPIDAALRLEAQVHVTDDGIAARHRLAYERRDILTVCHQPQAVAELAARLGLHLGVTRVLVGDLVAMGLLALRSPEQPVRSANIIERVIRGLQAIG